MPPVNTNHNEAADRKEMARDKRRTVGGVIWNDFCRLNDDELRETVDDLLDLMPELAEREQQITVKRVIKRLNNVSQRNSRMINFRDDSDTEEE